MKKEQLESLGLSEEQIKNVMAINGNDIEHFKKDAEKFKTDLAEKDKSIQALNEQISALDGNTDEIQKLKDEIQKYKDAEQTRIANEKKANAEKELDEQISALIGENEFVSDFAKSGFMAAIKQKREEDKVSGLKDIFESLTKDQTGIFKNKQQEKINIPPVGGKDNNSIKARMDEKYKDNPFYKS